MTDKEVVHRADFLHTLLSEFHATLDSLDPDVGCDWYGARLSFNEDEWEWLEPLLVELREIRAIIARARK